MWCKLTDR